MPEPTAAIVDYGMGNLFSVKRACESVGMKAEITSSSKAIFEAEAVILPGVGAFGHAMETLKELNLVTTLQEVARSSKPFLGICLGMQLMMTESFEFGHHEGLGLIPGSVRHFEDPRDSSGKILKVPQVGWNRISPSSPNSWEGTPLEGLPEGEFMYFVHSYYVTPQDSKVSIATSRYGHLEFCSSLNRENLFACQFHPERSGPQGLKIYAQLKRRITCLKS